MAVGCVAVDDGAMDGTVWPWMVCCGLCSHSLEWGPALVSSPGAGSCGVEECLCSGLKVIKDVKEGNRRRNETLDGGGA